MIKPFGIIYLIWKNISRRPVRYGILVLCVAAVVCLQVTAELMERSTESGVKLGLERMGADLVAVPRGLGGKTMRSFQQGAFELFYMDREIEARIAGYDFVLAASPQVYLKSLSGRSCCSIWNIFLIGFDPATDFVIRPWLREHKDVKIGPDDIIIGPAVPASAGKSVSFFGRNFNVAGVLDKSETGIDRAVFIPIETVFNLIAEKEILRESIGADKISAVLIRLKPEESGGIPAWKAAPELENAIKEISVIQPIKLVRKVNDNLQVVLKTLQSAGYAVWPVAALLIGLVFAMSTAERRREIGLFRAMGAARLFIFMMIMLESLSVAFAGALLGIAASFAFVLGLSGRILLSTEIMISLPAAGEIFSIVVIAFCLALLAGAAAAIIPAARISTEEPYEAIRRGE